MPGRDLPSADPLDESSRLLRQLQAAVDAALQARAATPGLVREAASVARALAILAKEQRAQRSDTRARFEALTAAERDDLATDYLCERPPEVRAKAYRQLAETLTGARR